MGLVRRNPLVRTTSISGFSLISTGIDLRIFQVIKQFSYLGDEAVVGVLSRNQKNIFPKNEIFFSDISKNWWDIPYYNQVVNEKRIMAVDEELRPIAILTSGPISLASIASLETELEMALQSSDIPLPQGMLSWHAMNHELDSSTITHIAQRLRRLGAVFNAIGDEHVGDDQTSKMYDARENVQSYAKALKGDQIICWLDSDLEFSALVQDEKGLSVKQPWPWIHMVWHYALNNKDVDFAVADVTGDPPIPSSSTILTNLRDLAQIGELSNGERWSIRDPAYDLSDQDRPRVRFPPIGQDWGGGDLANLMLWKGTLNRPLVASATVLNKPHRPWYVRGGITVVFNKSVLNKSTPRFICNGQSIRRGDSFWLIRILMEKGIAAGHFPFPMLHRRSSTVCDSSELVRSFQSRFFADLFGAAALKGTVQSLENRDDNLHDCIKNAVLSRASHSVNVLSEALETLPLVNGELSKADFTLIDEALTNTIAKLKSVDIEGSALELHEQIQQFLEVKSDA